jgi:hypothetical protein
VLLGQSYCTPHGAVIDECGAMVELRLKAKAVLYTPCRRLGEMIYSSYSFLTSALDKG